VADEATENVTVGKERGRESGGNGATHTHTHTHTHEPQSLCLPNCLTHNRSYAYGFRTFADGHNELTALSSSDSCGEAAQSLGTSLPS